MTVASTRTLTVTIDAPYDVVCADLGDPSNHPAWATEFFAGPATRQPDGSVLVPAPMMGGVVHFAVEADPATGHVNLYLAPEGAPFGDPLPVRLLRNGSGVDVLWTLTRPDGIPDAAWDGALASMSVELGNLRRRHEG